MNTVEPIRGRVAIRKLGDRLRANPTTGERDFCLYMCGLYLGRRISDILPLRVKDVKDRDNIYFREAKKNKESCIVINKDLKRILKSYCNGKKENDFLFSAYRGTEPISRIRYWQILNKAAREVGLKDKIGCHSLRKSLGRHLYHDMGVDIFTIMLILNHDDVNYTKRYIGVNTDEVNKVLDKVKFM